MGRADSDNEAASQDLIERFLGSAESYDHGPSSVRLVQTHASYVAIATPYVFKVKKPVNLGFLDFATLESRKYYCEEEVRLNSRLCPSIYLGVIPIYAVDGRYTFDRPGEASPVEYAVKMRKLSSEGFLDRMLDEPGSDTKVSTAVTDRIAARLEQFYSGQPANAAITNWGSVERIRISTDENFAQTRQYLGTGIPEPTFSFLEWYTDQFFSTHAELFQSRQRDGRILDCHGDLHCEHIHLTPDRVCIYDCIEFNERFRYIDIANDIAFLSMDLRRHGRPDLSRAIAQRIAADLGDEDLLLLLPFYACYRAYVRGKVELFRSSESEVPKQERTESRESARQYFRLALDYALTNGKPVVVICMGRVGTGKSTTAERLSELTGWNVQSSDRIRKVQHGVALHERQEAEVARLYTDESTRRVYQTMAGSAIRNAASGVSTVLDATYSRRSERDNLRSLLGTAQVPYVFIELSAGRGTVIERLGERETREDTVSDARLEDLEQLDRRYEAVASEERGVIPIRSEGAVDNSVLELLKGLRGALLADLGS